MCCPASVSTSPSRSTISIEHLGVADQRRGDLQHAVAAVVGAGDQARLQQPPGQEAAQQALALAGVERRSAASSRDELDRPEEAAAADVADDRQRAQLLASARARWRSARVRSRGRRRARRSRCSSARSRPPAGGRRR